MPSLNEEILLDGAKETVFTEIVTIDFMKDLDSNFGFNTKILFQNQRLIRSLSKVDRIGDVEIERIIIPETFTIITQRRPPMAPFIYQLTIQILCDYKKGTLLKWINEFELDEDNKPREEMIVSIIRKNDILNLQKTQKYMNKRP